MKNMQVNPKIQYNGEDEGLSLENPSIDHDQIQSSNDAQDENELLAAEEQQKDVVAIAEPSRKISLKKQAMRLRKDDRMIVAGTMMAGVLSVVIIYMIIVITW